ncbi:hypothetical protein HIM_02573 [Hirsutella minnesotensis 3608]|nr:hypothetical protein HIM_02573 [Hirsutella minnesotensis 3608]
MDWDFSRRSAAVSELPSAYSPEPTTRAYALTHDHPSRPFAPLHNHGSRALTPIDTQMGASASRSRSPTSTTASTRTTSFISIASHPKFIKYGRGRHSDVELIPQPSDDPNDPLNWPRWRKDLNLVSLLLTVALVGSAKTAFVATAGAMAVQYNTSYTAVAALTAVPICLSTLTGLGCAAAAKLWGKRPMYLASAILMLAGTIWAATAGDSYTFCMGARVLQGLGWGAFDTLVLGSIQDIYFEHERNFPVTLYNIFNIATTWGSPLIGGFISAKAGSFTAQFQIIAAFHAFSIPLLVLGAAETTFDRSRLPSLDSISVFDSENHSDGADSGVSRLWCRHPSRFRRAAAYCKDMMLHSWYSGPKTMSKALQAPRALVAPTTCLLFALSLIPFGALWGLAVSMALIAAPAPLSQDPAHIGTLMSGPWVLGMATVGGFCFYRGFHQKFTRRIIFAMIGFGTFLIIVGLLSFGLGLHNFMSPDPRRYHGPEEPFSLQPTFFSSQAARQLSLPLVSFQLGILAGGFHVLDTTTRPLLVRSASFTSSSVAVAHRSIGDMHAGVVVLRNLSAAVFVVAAPAAISQAGGLMAAVIGLAAVHTLLVAGVVTFCSFFDELVWRADGRVMGLVDLKMLKQSISFFDHD